MWYRALCVIGMILGMVAVPARADDVTDQLKEALRAYEKKDLATATAAVDAAATLLRQMRAELWKTVLPDALSGWTAEEAQSTSVSAAVLGGGTTVSRRFTKGNEHVEVSVITDSPLLQGIAMLFNSGLVTGGDLKLVVIDGRKVIYTKNENSYQVLVNNKSLVKVEASRGVDEATLRAYLAAVKFKQIEAGAQ